MAGQKKEVEEVKHGDTCVIRIGLEAWHWGGLSFLSAETTYLYKAEKQRNGRNLILLNHRGSCTPYHGTYNAQASYHNRLARPE